jgi:uncharacterized HhH-GPD family protein
MAEAVATPFTGDPGADELLASDGFALLLGMLLDQQFPMEAAFRSPYLLKERLGGQLDAAAIAVMDPERLREAFRQRPILHRYPASMADRTQTLCRYLVEHYAGRAERIWQEVDTGDELFARLRALPGFGDQKARIFTAVLAKRLGVAPAGWQERAGTYGQEGYWSVADVDGPGALERVRANKREMKAAARKSAAPQELA